MNTSKLADLSEIVSSVAIVATLIYLTIQVQQNTEAMQAGQRQATAALDVQYLLKFTDNPSVILARTKSELTNEEAVQLTYSTFAYLRMRELDWIQYNNGVLDKATWVSYQNTLKLILSSPNTRQLWQKFGPAIVNPDFAKQVNELIEDLPVTNQLYLLSAFD